MEILFFVVIDIRIFMVGCNEEFLSCPHKSKKTLSQVGVQALFSFSLIWRRSMLLELYILIIYVYVWDMENLGLV
jgi:hypothetical protein